MHQYWGFGQHIQSEIAFPELLPTTFDKPDVTVSVGKTPLSLQGDDVTSLPNLQVSPSEYLLTVENIGKYYACNGDTIVIEPFKDADERSVRLFFLSNAMAAVLHQQRKIPLHASGIITGKGLTLFTGASGAGKSTLLYGLMQKGHMLFTDDVCVLQVDANTKAIHAVASYPMMKLWQDAVDTMKIDAARNYQLRPQLTKYGLFHHDIFPTHSMPVDRIFVIEKSGDVDAFEAHPMENLAAFSLLQENTYRRGYVTLMNLQADHFTIISKLTQQAAVTRVVRPAASSIPAFVDFIDSLL